MSYSKNEYRFTAEAWQNSNGFWQIRVKIRGDYLADLEEHIPKSIEAVEKSLIAKGYKVQQAKEKVVKKK